MKVASICARVILACFVLMPVSIFAEGSSLSDPIVMGTYANGSFVFKDSRSNSGYGNHYGDGSAQYAGQQSEDIFYSFTLKGNAEVSISTCESEIDTYIHLLKNDGMPLEHNDDNGPMCTGSRASIKTTLTAGTYYIVCEGYGQGTGLINLSVNVVVTAATFRDTSMDMRNYTKVWELEVPQRDGNAVLGQPVREARLSATYFDGLGRPGQLVTKQGSLATAAGLASDLVSVVSYDRYGRQQDKYLPYAARGTSGLFQDSGLYYQQQFYRSPSSPVSGQGEQYFFSRTEQEPAPLARVTRTMAAGNSWVGSGRGLALSYDGNTAVDSVRCWKVREDAGGMGAYYCDTVYFEGTLYKKATADEGGKKTIEYQDKQGKVVLRKVQEADLPAEGHSGWLCTYYIYDDLDRLRAVLQPLAVEEMNRSGSWTLDPVTLSELCFRYEYDARDRMVTRKVPGAGAVYMVYDTRDRLVMTQDARLRKPGQEQWLVTVYDSLNRPVGTGFWKSDQSLAHHLAGAADSDRYPDIASGFELLTQTHYDDYKDLPPGLQSSLAGGYAAGLGNAADHAEPLVASSDTKGRVTWTKVKVLGGDQYLAALNLYDEKGRLIQVQAGNYSGGMDITTTQYDFSGKVLGSYLEHQKSSGGTLLELATRNSYDDLGRLLVIEKDIHHSGYKSIARFEYDALGSLKHKILAPGYDNGQGLETLGYDYNIRGWLLGVNREYLRGKGSSGYNNRFFGFELGYDTPATQAGALFTHPQYNGNIAGTLWKSAGDEVRRKYDFSYDAVNRLGKAEFSQNTDPASGAGGSYNTERANFSVQGVGAGSGDSLIGYDANGNILSMVQHGIRGLTPDAVIDALHYTYNPHSNKLQQVLDDNNDKGSLLGDFKYDPATKTSVDYGYDKNGNLVTDLNKQLSGVTGTDLEEGGAITYNHLNLPALITVAGKGSIGYIYDAAGNKLAKTVQESGKPGRTTLYMTAGIVYENDSLQFLAQEEGRIRPLHDAGNQVTGFAFDYFIKDQLGNVRMVLTDEQRSDRYPAASLEPAALESESLYYRIPAGATVNKATVPGYPQHDDYTSPNDYVQKLSGNAQRVGTSILLRVMSGDRVNIRASSWYRQNGASGSNVQSAAADIVSSLLQAIAGGAGGKTGMAASGQQQALSSGIAGFLQQPADQPGSSRPKASLNWLLLDEQLRPVITNDGANSGSQPVGEDQQLTLHQVTERPLTKNGYLYIYLSNESTNVDVFFDNLQVTHTRGPLMEETHYYPFGLEMAAISSKAAGRLDNKHKFNGGTELNNDLEIDLYETNHRFYDAQTGRFLQIDKLADITTDNSPYVYGNNNPISYNDPLGLLSTPGKPDVLEEVVVTAKKKSSWDMLSYASVSAWVDRQRTSGYNDEQINKYLSQQSLSNQTISRFDDAMSESATNIRDAENEYWEAQAEIAQFIGLSLFPEGEIGGFLGKIGTGIINAIGKSGGKFISKIINVVEVNSSSKVLLNTSRQLQAKFKHAKDFGILGNYNKVNASKFSSALNQHINSAEVQIINGSYKGKSVIHYVNSHSGVNILTNPAGEFISGWKLNTAQLQNVLKHGGL